VVEIVADLYQHVASVATVLSVKPYDRMTCCTRTRKEIKDAGRFVTPIPEAAHHEMERLRIAELLLQCLGAPQRGSSAQYAFPLWDQLAVFPALPQMALHSLSSGQDLRTKETIVLVGLADVNCHRFAGVRCVTMF